MKQTTIHPTAIIEEGAQLGNNVTVEAYAIIKKHVILEDDVVIKSHVYIDGHTTIGAGTTIFPFVSIGTKPQNRKYRGETTYVLIGKNCEIREYVTINASSVADSVVKVGDNCFIMAYCHIAHDCEVGNHVIMSNGATLAGHVLVEDHVNIGGMTGVHQHVRIGCYAMVGGMSGIPCDVPPYTIGSGRPFEVAGLNLIGLKRHGFTLDTRKELTKAFKLVYRSDFHLQEALAIIEKEAVMLPEVKHWLQFCQNTKRGLVALQNETSIQMEEEELVQTV